VEEDDDVVTFEPVPDIEEIVSPARSIEGGGVLATQETQMPFYTETISRMDNTTSIKTTGLYQAVSSQYSAFVLHSGPAAGLVRNCRIRKDARVKPDPGTKQAYGVYGVFTAFAYGGVFVKTTDLVPDRPYTAMNIVRLDANLQSLRQYKKQNTVTPVILYFRQPNISIAAGEHGVSNPASAESNISPAAAAAAAAGAAIDIPLNAPPAAPMLFSAPAPSRPLPAAAAFSAAPQQPALSSFTPNLTFRSTTLAIMDAGFALRAWSAVKKITPGLYNTVMADAELQARIGILNDVLLTIGEFSSDYLITDSWHKTLIRVIDLIKNPNVAIYYSPNDVIPESVLNNVLFAFGNSL
jgi:hypothetical protein